MWSIMVIGLMAFPVSENIMARSFLAPTFWQELEPLL